MIATLQSQKSVQRLALRYQRNENTQHIFLVFVTAALCAPVSLYFYSVTRGRMDQRSERPHQAHLRKQDMSQTKKKNKYIFPWYRLARWLTRERQKRSRPGLFYFILGTIFVQLKEAEAHHPPSGVLIINPCAQKGPHKRFCTFVNKFSKYGRRVWV